MNTLKSVLLVLALSLGAPAYGSSLADAELLSRTISAIGRHYVDPDRIDARKMFDSAIERVAEQVPEVLIQYTDTSAVLTVGEASQSYSLEGLTNLSGLNRLLKASLAYIDAHYTGTKERTEIEYAAIDGMLAALDPHSNFLSPAVLNEFKVGTKGIFGGLGIVIGNREGKLTVIAPLDGTPAARVGIQAGDHILQIDHESTINMSLTDAVDRLRGEVGSHVRLVIERSSRPAPFTVTLTRALINIESVKHAEISRAGKRIGYLSVKNFQANTDQDVTAALGELHRGKEPLDGLILDLRNDPGGLLDQSILLADHFLAAGTIVTTVAAHGRLLDRDSSHQEGTEPPYPLIVLINEGSASASEIVAGSLKANDRALIMGRRSFGKGSVQTIFELSEDAAVKLTIAQYLAGGRLPIQLIGVVPDIELVPATIDREAMNLIEDSSMAEGDLEKHLERGADTNEKPMLQLRYLEPKKSEKAEDLAAAEYAKGPAIDHDFAVQLAVRLLAEAGQPTGQTLLHAAQPILAEERASQERAIGKAMADVGINWNIAAPEIHPLLRVAFNLKRNGVSCHSLNAGDKATLELVATNVGKGPLSQLVAVGKSDTAFLNNKEFPFGLLPPGSSGRWETPVTIPEGSPTQDYTMNIEFTEAHDLTPAPFEAVVPVLATGTPQFAYSYYLKKSGGKVQPKSSGTHTLDVDITNVGAGRASAETIAALANRSGDKLFLQKGRVVIGPLSPGGKKTAEFEFRIDPTYEKPEAELELVISDPNHATQLAAKLKLTVANGKLEPPASKRYQAPTIELAVKPPSTTAASHFRLEGTVNDDGPVHDYLVFVGERKIAYALSRNPFETSIPFSVDIPLAPGDNIVTIAARDGFDLTGRRIISIRRPGPVKTADVAGTE